MQGYNKKVWYIPDLFILEQLMFSASRPGGKASRALFSLRRFVIELLQIFIAILSSFCLNSALFRLVRGGRRQYGALWSQIINKFAQVGGCVLIFCLAGCQFLPGGKTGGEKQKTNLTPCIVLALPNSGPYAPIATKIKRGANVAAENLKKAGVAVQIRQADTESSDWIANLQALPEQCAVVGGPLQDKTYISARNSGIMQKKAFFSFVPNLHQGDEGNLAWRFFPSPEDQIQSLIKFATHELNIRSFGALYPDDAYGRRMTEIFRNALQKQHMSLMAESYNPSAPATWSDAAARLINPAVAEDGKTRLPQTTFEALFLPESWKHMELLANSLLYSGEDRLVLMGPMLWEQSLTGKKVANAEKFALAVFPGAWSPASVPASLKSANPDFWVALGYDFINFAVASGIDRMMQPAEITAAAQKGSSMIRAMSPMRWNDQGKASQNLYLFQVGPTGPIPADREHFIQARQAARENAALRMQGLPPEDSPAEEPVSGLPETSNVSQGERQITAPQTPPLELPPLGTTPQPSYKLRLPAKP